MAIVGRLLNTEPSLFPINWAADICCQEEVPTTGRPWLFVVPPVVFKRPVVLDL